VQFNSLFVYVLSQQPQGHLYNKHKQIWKKNTQTETKQNKAPRTIIIIIIIISIALKIMQRKKMYIHVFILCIINILIWRKNHFIKKNSFGSKYVNINSWSASVRRAIFTWRADIEQNKVSGLPSRNSETNSFQKWTEFRAKVNFSKEECIEATTRLVWGVWF
jgi:hypothetical protein